MVWTILGQEQYDRRTRGPGADATIKLSLNEWDISGERREWKEECDQRALLS